MGILCLGTLVPIVGLHVDARQDVILLDAGLLAETLQGVIPLDAGPLAEILQDAIPLDAGLLVEILQETEDASTPFRVIVKLEDVLKAVTCHISE